MYRISFQEKQIILFVSQNTPKKMPSGCFSGWVMDQIRVMTGFKPLPIFWTQILGRYRLILGRWFDRTGTRANCGCLPRICRLAGETERIIFLIFWKNLFIICPMYVRKL